MAIRTRNEDAIIKLDVMRQELPILDIKNRMIILTGINTIKEQQVEIDTLKIDLRKSKQFNCGLADESCSQQAEINELKAMVNSLHESLSKNQEWVRCGIGGNCGGYPQDHKDYIELTNLLGATKEQCLSNVKGDAVKEFGCEIGLYNSEYDDQGYIEVSRYSLKDHIEKLREQAK